MRKMILYSRRILSQIYECKKEERQVWNKSWSAVSVILMMRNDDGSRRISWGFNSFGGLLVLAFTLLFKKMGYGVKQWYPICDP